MTKETYDTGSMRRGSDDCQTIDQGRTSSRRESMRTKKVENEEINFAQNCTKGTGTLRTKALRWSTGAIFVVAEPQADHRQWIHVIECSHNTQWMSRSAKCFPV